MLINFLYILLADRISADGKSRKIGLPKGLSVLHNLLANLYSMDWCNESDCTKKKYKNPTEDLFKQTCYSIYCQCKSLTGLQNKSCNYGI